MALIAACLAACLLAGTAAGAPPPVEFDQRGSIATSEGHTTLSWAAGEAGDTIWTFELQDAPDPSFASAHTWYRGPDRASFVSGLPEGTTWFRVRVVEDGGAAGPWSAPIAVEVHYASRTMLVWLLGLGAIVFLTTVTTVIAGHRRHDVELR